MPSVRFQSWSRFLVVSLQVTRVINPAVGCHYFPPGLQLPSQPLRGLPPVSLLAEQRHDGCEQFDLDCYPTASRLRYEPRPFCAWVQHANHSATEPYACTLVNWGGKWDNRFVVSVLSNISANNFQKRLMCVKVIVCSISVVLCFNPVC